VPKQQPLRPGMRSGNGVFAKLLQRKENFKAFLLLLWRG
jgi:hypothetical protein